MILSAITLNRYRGKPGGIDGWRSDMNILIAIGFALLALFLLVALVKLAFGLIVLALVLGTGVAAYFFMEKLIGQGR